VRQITHGNGPLPFHLEKLLHERAHDRPPDHPLARGLIGVVRLAKLGRPLVTQPLGVGDEVRDDPVTKVGIELGERVAVAVRRNPGLALVEHCTRQRARLDRRRADAHLIAGEREAQDGLVQHGPTIRYTSNATHERTENPYHGSTTMSRQFSRTQPRKPVTGSPQRRGRSCSRGRTESTACARA
jgi:hypothetical protein